MASGGYKGASPARETSPEQYPGVWELTEQFQAQAEGNWPFQETDCAPKSLRFNESSPYSELVRTPTVAGNTKTFTISFWCKRAKLGSTQMLIQTGDTYSNLFRAYWDGNDNFVFHQYNGSYVMNMITSARYRDPSAWYHYVIALDTTQATAAHRAKFYVNGVEVTDWATASYPAQDLTTGYNASIKQRIGREYTTTYGNYYNYEGLLAEYHSIEGQALSCEEFGFFDGQGLWMPKRFTGDYSSGGTANTTDDVYAWGLTFDNVTGGGGWYFTTEDNASSLGLSGNTGGHADELGGNTIGQRNGESTVGAWGTIASLNGYTAGQSARSMSTNTDMGTTGNPGGPISFVWNKTNGKVWVIGNGDSSAIGGGDPNNPASTPTFLLPTTGKVAFGFVSGNTNEEVTLQAINSSLFSGSHTLPKWRGVYDHTLSNSNATSTANSGGYRDVWSDDLNDNSIAPTVGRNSFHIDFSQDEVGEVKDQSGLGNDWTANDIEGPAKGLLDDIVVSGPSNVTPASSEYWKLMNGNKDNYAYAHSNDATNYIEWTPSGGYPTDGHIWIQGGDGNGAGTNTMEVQINGSVVSRTAVVDNETYTQAAYGWGDWHKYPVAGNTLTSLKLTGAYALIRQLSTVDDPTHSVLGISDDNDVPAIVDTRSSVSDYFVDAPVNGNEASTGAGGERRGCYATLNPLNSTASTTLSNGNLAMNAGGGWGSCMSTVAFTGGKFYYETTVDASNYSYIGVSLATHLPTRYPSQDGSWALLNNGYCYYDQTGSNEIIVNTGTSVPAGAVVGTAIDADNGKIWWSVNGSWIGSGSPNPATGADAIFTNIPTDQTLVACLDVYSNSATVNFGQVSFSYAAPAGFSPLATSFLPEPAIKRGDEGLDVVLWSGDNAVSRSIKTSLSPDFAWIKVRNAANTWHHITDIVRGAPNKLYPNDPAAEDTTPIYGQVDSLDTDGFTVGDGTHASNPLADVNQTGVNYVGYAFDAGEATTTIAAGSSNSSVYDRSKAWSSLVTTSSLHSSYNSYGPNSKFGCFDGKRNTSMYSASGPLTITFDAQAFPASGGPYFVEVQTNQRGIKVNGQPSSGYTTDIASGQATYWANNGSVSSLTSVEINQASAAYGGMTNQIRVNGKILADSINNNVTWSNSLSGLSGSSLTNPPNGFDADESSYADSTAGFTLDLSGHTFGTGAHTIEVKSGGATSFSVNGSTSLTDPGGGGAKVWTGTHTGELTSLASSATGASVYYIKIDGEYLLDPGQDFVTDFPSISATVRARPEVGFSIVKWLNPSASASIAHGLNASAPDFIVTKYLGGNSDLWQTYHRSLGNAHKLYLSEPDSKVSSTMWQTEHPNTGTFNANDNTTGNWIAYCWSSVENYSKFTSFTGTGGDVFVYLGFKPRLIWFKNADASTNWLCYDTARNPSNPANFSLQLDEPNTDTTVTNDEIDILSNGFNIKATRSDLTGNGNKILVAAWAEHPFASNARAR